MPFEKFVRTKFTNKNDPTVTLDKSHFRYNPVAAQQAELANKNKVIYHIDEESRKIGFEFMTESGDRSAYSLFGQEGKKSFRSAISELCRRHLWIRSVAHLADSSSRAFPMKPDFKLWTIQLCPAFEICVGASDDLPSDKGIYRYLDANGDVVYIGKGTIRRRYAEPGRDKWGISRIEYSIVDGDSDQYEWERYWLEKYKEKHHGHLPPFNRVGGHS